MYAKYNIVYKDFNTYTIDMLRLRADLTYEEFSKIEFRINSIFKEQVKNEYTSFGISEFKHNYNIEVKEGSSYWFGFIHNSEIINKTKGMQNPNTRYNFTIEFNPNKVEINGLLKYILSITKNWTIKSADFAVDIPINILDLCGLDKGRKKDFRMFSAGFDNKTYYMGRSNNRIKIYNKKIESSLDRDLTRMEITSKLDLNINNIYFFKYDVILPDLYLNDYLYTFKSYEDKTLLAILYAVQNGFPLNDLTRAYKNKVKDLLHGKYQVNIENQYFTEVLKNCICNIFEWL